MNIKRAFLTLAAMVIGTLLAASPSVAGTYGTVIDPYTVGTNTITCRSWTNPTPMWPANNADYFVCTSTLNPTASSARADTLIGPVVGLNTQHPLYETLSNAQYKYYYFQTRADANAFMEAKYPGRADFLKSDTARCGNTGTLTGVGGENTIISIVYETCIYGGALGSGQNPNLAKTAAHETGHGYDFVHNAVYGHLISESPGFIGLANGIPGVYSGDIAYMKPANWDNGSPGQMSAAQKATLLCSIYFKQLVPSTFEVSTGVPNNAVCIGNAIAPAYVGLNPTQIAIMRLPYFITSGVSGGTPLYRDLFAELFSKQMPSVPSNPPLLVVTDTALHDTGVFPCTLVAGVYTCDYKNNPGSAFHCTTWVVSRFYANDQPPPANTVASPGTPTPLSLKSRGCPDLGPSQF